MTERMGEFIYLVTSPDMETSKKLAQVVIANKIAACVNIIPEISSIYWWKDHIEENQENLQIGRAHV